MTDPTPRVGGGKDSGTWWTGGSNRTKRTKAKTVLARRPTDFRDAEKIEMACRKGLPEERRLGLPEETGYTISLSAWIREIKKNLEDCGTDTVFLVYDPTANLVEMSLFENFGSVSDENLKEWIESHKTTGVKKTDTTREDVCEWDVDNLEWSGDMIKNSVSFKLWRDIEGLLPGTTGPEIFQAVCTRLQHTSASTCRTLVSKLEQMKLSKEPGMDVNTFSLKILGILEKIEKCSESTVSSYLSLVVATCYQNTGVGPFDLDATTLFNKCDEDPKSMTPRQLITKLKAKYTSLESRNQWPHKNQKQKQDELSAMNGKLNALTQKFESFNKSGGQASNNNNQNKTNNNNKKPDHTGKTCYHCGGKDHIKPNCPNKDDGKPDVGPGGSNNSNNNNDNSTPPPAWMLKAPAQGESEKKTVDGVEYRFCNKCKLGKQKKPMWRSGKKSHVTSDCKSKPRAGALGALGSIPEETPISGPLTFQGFT